MLTKEKKTFTSLIIKPEHYGVEVAPSMCGCDKPAAPKGKMLYLSDVELPLKDSDSNKELKAEIKVIPRSIVKTTENGKTRHSYDLELTGIRFMGD